MTTRRGLPRLPRLLSAVCAAGSPRQRAVADSARIIASFPPPIPPVRPPSYLTWWPALRRRAAGSWKTVTRERNRNSA